MPRYLSTKSRHRREYRQALPQHDLVEKRQENRRRMANTRAIQREIDLCETFELKLNQVGLMACAVCKKLEMTQTIPNNFTCNYCCRVSEALNKFTALNNMDPGVVPPELSNLTYVEQMLIARVHPVMRVYQLRTSGMPGQFRYGGHVINFEQDVTEFARSLPHHPSTLKTVIIRKQTVQGYTDFRVRRQRVRNALAYLKHHNKYYAHVTIDESVLSQLPEDNSIADTLNELISIAEIRGTTGPSMEHVEDMEITESGVTGRHQIQQRHAIQQVLAEHPADVVSWPTTSDTPVNEYTHEGYIVCAFPHLFPTGAADFLDHTRSNNLSIREYFQHLLRYYDRRFANDPRFRFLALNTIQRREACTLGTVYANKHHFGNNTTVQRLRAALEENTSVLGKFVHWASNQRGSRPYWFQRRLELEAMVEQLGIPTLFITLSAADLWWPDLARHLGVNFEEELQMTEEQIGRFRQKLINDNPLVVDEYFQSRAETYFKTVLKSYFQVKDHWYRFEYQHRGSPHLHGILWLLDAPDVRRFNNANQNEMDQFCSYYDNLMSAIHPNISQPPAEIHPSRKRSTDIQIGDVTDMSECANRFQRHTRHGKYCQKSVGYQTICRFGYPKTCATVSKLEKNEKGIWEYTPARNDELLNSCNWYILQSWRANTDIQVIASEHAVINYIAKYASKHEPQSENLRNVFSNIVQTVEPDVRAVTVIRKIFIAVVGERDISAQETTRLIMGNPLYSSTRQFNKLFIGLQEYVQVIATGNESVSLIDSYRSREGRLELSTLLEYAKNYYVTGRKTTRSRKDRIVQLYPKVRTGITGEQDELYFKQQVILNIPFRNESSLLIENETWKDAYRRLNVNGMWQLNLDDADIEQEEEEAEIDFEDRDWLAIANAPPNVLPNDVTLGKRDIDLYHNWYQSHESYPDINERLKFIETAKAADPDCIAETNETHISFNDKQLSVLNHVRLQLANEVDVERLCVIQGAAGTGKSCVIREIVHMVTKKYGEQSCVLLAPTGVASNNINGMTIHSALNIPATRTTQITELSGEAELQLQERFTNVRFAAIDEFSMVGCSMLAAIDKRLRQAKPENSNIPFGGLYVYLIGDLAQLPPVFDTPLYGEPRNASATDGKLIYMQFTKTFFLEQVMRQDETQIHFKNMLQRVASGSITHDDYTHLSTRFKSNNPTAELDDVIRIKAKNEDIDEYNEHRLRILRKPVAYIHANHNNATAVGAPSDAAQGLRSVLQLSVGTTVILRKNLWTAKGLCNGSFGKVIDIIYHPNPEAEVYYQDVPVAILIKFDKYTGPTIYNGCIPIIPLTVCFKIGTTNCTRKQFPVAVAFAVSVHRSQGLSLNQAVVDIGPKEFALGLAYVAFSRVRSEKGLIIDPGFAFSRLEEINKKPDMQRRNKEINRLMYLQ